MKSKPCWTGNNGEPWGNNRLLYLRLTFLRAFSCKTQEAQATTSGAFWKKLFLKFSQNPQENTCVSVFFSKENMTQELSCKFCKILKSIFFIKFEPDGVADFKGYTVKFFLQSISRNTNLTLISQRILSSNSN